MGTRNLIMAVIANEYKIAQYGQWDGYPEGQGLIMLRFLSAVRLGILKFVVSECQWLTEKELDDIDSYIKETSTDWKNFYPELHRNTGADIFKLVLFDKKRKLECSLEFVKDSLWCEWAYVVDFDKNTFEVYRGLNKTKLDANERFCSDYCSNGYYPVKHVKTFDLCSLPSEDLFLSECSICLEITNPL